MLREFVKKHYGSAFSVLYVSAELSGCLGGLELFFRMFHVFDALASIRGINIQRPHIPEGARRTFHAEGLYTKPPSGSSFDEAVRVIVDMKRKELQSFGTSTEQSGVLVPVATVKASLARTLTTDYRAVAFDYDGTLVSLDPKEEAPRTAIVAQIVRLLQGGVQVCIISGRGRSLLKYLRQSLPESLQAGLYCYLYNGAVLWQLDEEEPRFVVKLDECERLVDLVRVHSAMPSFAREIEIASLRTQITIHLVSTDVAAEAVKAVSASLAQYIPERLTVRTSGRSVDVFSKSISKSTALTDFKRRVLLDAQASVLVFGDQAQEGGNDCELLLEQHSFSVDRLNCSPYTCFPTLVDGRFLRGPEGLASFLAISHIRRGCVSISG